MDIQLEKYKLMEWLIGLKDERIISKVMSMHYFRLEMSVAIGLMYGKN